MHDHEHDYEHEPDRDYNKGGDGFISRLFGHSHAAADQTDSALESSARGMRVVALSLAGLGARVGTRAPNRRYTFGYGRAEDLAGVFIVAMIALSTALAGWQSVQRLFAPQPLNHIGWVIVGAIVGFIGNEVVAVVRIREGKRIGSAALEADGYHARTDGFASLAVLAGAIGVLLGFPLADPLVGILITVLIAFVLKSAAMDIYHRLMDAVDPALVSQVETALASVAGVEAVVSTRIRWVGHALWGEIRLVMDCDLNLAEAHRITEEAGHAVLHAVPKLTEVVVHPDPCGHGGEDHHAVAAHHPAV